MVFIMISYNIFFTYHLFSFFFNNFITSENEFNK